MNPENLYTLDFNKTATWLMDGLHKPEDDMMCYAPTMISTNGVWMGEEPLFYSIPQFSLQLMVIIFTTRILVWVLKPFHQPKVVAEILGGILLGPSGFGHFKSFAQTVFPMRSLIVLQTMASIGFYYFLFLVGLEMNFTLFKHVGRRALLLGIVSMAIPSIVGISTLYLFKENLPDFNTDGFLFFYATSISITAFPVLVRILAEIKMIHTDIGKLSVSASIITVIGSWVLLAMGMAKTIESPNNAKFIAVTITPSVGFILICCFILRPAINWVINRVPEGGTIDDFYVWITLAVVLICAFITDTIVSSGTFGAFLFGLIIPNGILADSLREKIEDFVNTLLLPLVFTFNGLNTDTLGIVSSSGIPQLLFSKIMACITKVASAVLFALFQHMTVREGLALGLLMNTGGLMEVIVLGIGLRRQVISDNGYALLVILSIVMTCITTPSMIAVYKSTKRFISYKHRTIQKAKEDGELKILVCLHTPRNVPTIINLVEVSNPTKKSPIYVYALHLIELPSNASTMLNVNNTRKPNHHAINRSQTQSEHIINAFKNYTQHKENVTVQPLTAISPYSTMHEDICNFAEEKQATLIIVPFHKQQTVDGGMEATNPAFRNVNQNVLTNAPCSVGVLIDRGLSGFANMPASQISNHIVMLFFGGPDDREALTYAWRMVQHPRIKLTVVRFLPGEQAVKPTVQSTDGSCLIVFTDNDKENQLNNEHIKEFQQKIANNEKIVYKEKVVNNGPETVSFIRSMDRTYDLYIVGRGQGMISPLTAGLNEWSECPELGAIGDLLASSDLAATMSVLVVQQYIGCDSQTDGTRTPRTPNTPEIYPNRPSHQSRTSSFSM